ncbi:MAG: hypothetical protein HKP22_08850, partial [Gammaproteobacteria bacterium]|nr:hypothetical protein [Gammaproteobacteria bacterium]
LDSVRDRVRQEWSADERKRFNEAFYEQLRSHYEVVIEPYPAQQLGKTAISVAGQG